MVQMEQQIQAVAVAVPVVMQQQQVVRVVQES
jgi:hypothetical protein